MSATDYAALIAASPGDRLDAFLATANRLGAPVANIEKDFWVCWTLDALYINCPTANRACSSRVGRHCPRPMV